MNPDQLLAVIGDLEVERRRLMAIIAEQQERLAAVQPASSGAVEGTDSAVVGE